MGPSIEIEEYMLKKRQEKIEAPVRKVTEKKTLKSLHSSQLIAVNMLKNSLASQ